MKLSKEEMAEVFELREKGVYWENLSIIFKVSKDTLRRYMRICEDMGFEAWDKK